MVAFLGLHTWAWATDVPAANFLFPNGTLNAAAIGNQSLSLDLKGWDVRLDPKLGPVFAPAPVVANGLSALDKGLIMLSIPSPSVVAMCMWGEHFRVSAQAELPLRA